MTLSAPRRSARVLIGVIASAALASGCSLISIDPIPSPFPDSLPYGQIVREIRVEGNRYTKTWVVEAALASQVGEPYTEEGSRYDYRWLAQMGVFTAVSFNTEPLQDGIAVIVNVKEGSPYIPSLSFKLTQENGIEVGPAFSSPNFLGFAGRMSAYARFGGATNFGVRYSDPWIPGTDWRFGYNLSYMHSERFNQLDDFEESSDEANFQLRRNLTKELRYGLRLSYMSVKSDRPGITLSPDNRDSFAGAGLFANLDTRNGPYPTNGWYLEAEAYKYGLFGSDVDYWQFTGDVRRYLPLPFGRRHSLAAYSLLTMATGEIDVDIPIYMDYHIGGTNSVRGWPLGSRVGKNQWLNTAEYWYRLADDRAFRFWFIKWRMGLQLGAFGDVGVAWYDEREFGQNFIAGFGGGLRLTIPVVVLLRLDLAYANGEFGLQFAVGGSEKAIAQRQRVR